MLDPCQRTVRHVEDTGKEQQDARGKEIPTTDNHRREEIQQETDDG